MKRLLATSAMSVVLMAFNADAAQLNPQETYQAQPSDIRASEFIGSRVYASENDFTEEASAKKGDEKDWDDIGEIDEILLSKSGEVEAVVIGVGGFLGIGEKDVAVPMKDIQFVKNGDEADDYFLVVNANKDILNEAPAYEPDGKMKETAATKISDEKDADTMKSAQSDTSMEKKADQTETAQNDMTDTKKSEEMKSAENMPTPLVRPEIERDGYQTAELKDLTADDLQGATVYGPKDEDMGEVSQIILNDDGTVDKLVLDIGGFLGMGEHSIAVGLDEVNIMRNGDTNEFRVYADANEEALKAKPEYEGN